MPAHDHRRTPNLHALLERVQEIWLSGVLADRLGEQAPLDVPLGLRTELVRPPSGHSVLSPSDLDGVVQLAAAIESSSASVLLTGGPGAGKSTLLLRLVAELVEGARADATRPVPVVVNLSAFRADVDLATWIAKRISRVYGVPQRWVEQWLERGQLLLAFDGFDELEPRSRRAAARALNAFTPTNGAPTILVSRTDAIEDFDESLQFDAAVELGQLSEEMVVHTLGARADTLLGGDMPTTMRNPLWIQLAREVERDAEDIEDLDDLYARYLDRAIADRGDRADTRSLPALQWLARTMDRLGVSELWLESLQLEWLESRAARIAAVFVCLTLVALPVMGLNLLAGTSTSAGLVSGLVVGAAAFATVLLVFRRFRVEPSEALMFDPIEALRALPWMLPIVTTASVLAGVAERGFSIALIVGPALVNGIAGGLVASLVKGLRPSDTLVRVQLNQGSRQSARNALTYGMGVFAFALAAWWILVSPLAQIAAANFHSRLPADYRWANSLTAATFGGTVTAMVHGGFAVALHLSIRTMLAVTTPMGLDLTRVLERGVTLRLLRRVGGGHAFLHATLQQHLATHAPPRSST